jgi:hypothetical protein
MVPDAFRRPGAGLPAGLLGWAFAVLVITALPVAVLTPVRILLTLPFLLVAPGAAVVPLLRLRDTAMTFTLVVALSVAVLITVGQIMIYSHAWSPGAALAGLELFVVLGSAAQLVLAHHARPGAERHGLPGPPADPPSVLPPSPLEVECVSPMP